jgi:hypothetical protein
MTAKTFFFLVIALLLCSSCLKGHELKEKNARYHYKIHSLLKDLNCGADNQEVPHFLTIKQEGTPKFVVDIGLNDGKETIAAAKSGYILFSFEPRKESIDAVAAALSLEGIKYEFVDLEKWKESPPTNDQLKSSSTRVYLFNAAVGDVEGEVEIMVSDVSPGSSIVDILPSNYKKKKVPVIRIDDYVFQQVYLFKSDTQGYDYRVLLGARH